MPATTTTTPTAMTITEGTLVVTSETVFGTTYEVTLRPCGHDSCHCPDFHYRSGSNVEYKCKHIRKARGLPTTQAM